MHDRSQPAEAGSGGGGGAAGEGGGNVDRVLFKNLVEMVPLVESLMVSGWRADLAGAGGQWRGRLILLGARAPFDRCPVLVAPGCRTGGRTRPTRAAPRSSTRRRRPRRSVPGSGAIFSSSINSAVCFFLGHRGLVSSVPVPVA